jgi:2-phospho-L-lactate guanylyltransferase
MILVPVKNLTQAKQRLSAILDPEARQELAQAMCADVLETLAGWPGRPAVTVVTSDPFAANLATRLAFEVVADDVNPGETGAIAMATALCRELGVDRTLVIPADIPLIERDELAAIVDSAPSAGTVLVPDAAGRGTNAALRTPADLFPLRQRQFSSPPGGREGNGLAVCRAGIAGYRARCGSPRGFTGAGGRQRRTSLAAAGPKLEPGCAGLSWVVAARLEKSAFSRCRWQGKFIRAMR